MFLNSFPIVCFTEPILLVLYRSRKPPGRGQSSTPHHMDTLSDPATIVLAKLLASQARPLLDILDNRVSTPTPPTWDYYAAPMPSALPASGGGLTRDRLLPWNPLQPS